MDFGDDEDEGGAAVATAPVRPRLEGTRQQHDFWQEVIDGDAHILLEARAGTGKSTSCAEAMHRVGRGPRQTYSAFNKHIAAEFAAKAPPHVRSATMHSLGYGALRDAFGEVAIDAYRVEALAEKYFPRKWEDRESRNAVGKLASLCKANLEDGTDPAALTDLAGRYGIDLGPEAADVLAILPDVLDECKRLTTIIDYDDMIWLPVVLGLRPRACDLLYLDECLPSWTPVLLADGSSRTIGDIVDNKLPVEVLAYDTETGQQRPCRVTGWSRTLNRKPLVKIRVAWNRKKRGNRPTNFVTCTVDHKVWADGRWIPAGEVRPGMTVQVETSATKAQKGKITTRGRAVLAGLVASRNESGMMSHPHDGFSRPPVRGGNGTGPTLAEQTLFDALGIGWTMQHVVKTGLRNKGYPHHYKIDLAQTEKMIAVEVDGETHRGKARARSDRRKDEFLRSKGWKVVRVPNRVAIQETEACAIRINASDCPIGATVVSVDPVSIPDSYVYDISVEDCHDFYANGILVHNCQDLCPSQQAFAERLCPEGRIVIVGDPFQSIYAFRGADSDSIPNLSARLGATARGIARLPLTITWRCPASHVRLANAIVPDLEAAPGAAEGIVECLEESKAIARLQPGDMVLCRNNAPLVSACFRLLKRGVKATVRGRDIGKGLLVLIAKLRARSIPDLVERLDDHRVAEAAKLQRLRHPEPALAALFDKVDCLQALTEGCRSVDDLKAKVEAMFSDSDESSAVVFSSVHKAKGLERDSITILRPDLLPHPMAKTFTEVRQELNLSYVAATRSKHRLTFAGEIPACFKGV